VLEPEYRTMPATSLSHLLINVKIKTIIVSILDQELIALAMEA
jgi:hypothetical protein